MIDACVRVSQMPRCGPEPFRIAAEKLEAADFGAYAAAARYRQGERTDGHEGQQLRDAAVAWLTRQGVRNPVRMIRCLAPVGRPEDG